MDIKYFTSLISHKSHFLSKLTLHYISYRHILLYSNYIIVAQSEILLFLNKNIHTHTHLLRNSSSTTGDLCLLLHRTTSTRIQNHLKTALNILCICCGNQMICADMEYIDTLKLTWLLMIFVYDVCVCVFRFAAIRSKERNFFIYIFVCCTATNQVAHEHTKRVVARDIVQSNILHSYCIS